MSGALASSSSTSCPNSADRLVMDNRDAVWMLTSTPIFRYMPTSGVGLLYGGIVGNKNIMNTIFFIILLSLLVTIPQQIHAADIIISSSSSSSFTNIHTSGTASTSTAIPLSVSSSTLYASSHIVSPAPLWVVLLIIFLGIGVLVIVCAAVCYIHRINDVNQNRRKHRSVRITASGRNGHTAIMALPVVAVAAPPPPPPPIPILPPINVIRPPSPTHISITITQSRHDSEISMHDIEELEDD